MLMEFECLRRTAALEDAANGHGCHRTVTRLPSWNQAGRRPAAPHPAATRARRRQVLT